LDISELSNLNALQIKNNSGMTIIFKDIEQEKKLKNKNFEHDSNLQAEYKIPPPVNSSPDNSFWKLTLIIFAIIILIIVIFTLSYIYLNRKRIA
jgi:hypothetical protein